MMVPIQRGPRVSLHEVKARMVKVLGQQKEQQYSTLLSRYLLARLSKAELDRLVPSTIGKENLGLHNNYVRAIIRNVTCAEPPPPPSDFAKPSPGKLFALSLLLFVHFDWFGVYWIAHLG
jgi:hypothetical protein